MSSDWSIAKFGEVTINFDTRRKPVKEADRKPGPYPYYGASGVVDHVESYLFDGDYLLIAEDGENLRTRQTPIAFMASGKFWVNNHAHIVTGNEKASTRYLQYALLGTDIHPYLTGAVMPKLTQGNMNKIEVPCPPWSVQDKIVGVLGTLDDRIALLRETNATLEAIAQALFKSWFVDFDPVHAKQKGRAPEGMDEATAALFPDSFEESELGLVPRGWRAGTLADVTTVKGGFAYKSEAFGTEGLPVIKIKNIVGDGTVNLLDCQYISAEIAEKTKKFVLKDGDIVIAMTGATIGKTGVVVTVDNQMPYLNQRVAKLEANSSGHNNSWFVYVAFQNSFIFDQVVNAASGSAQPNISTNGIESVRLVLPSKSELLSTFNDIVSPLFNSWMANAKQAQTLATLRDTLLPRLISGQLRLTNMEGVVS